MHRYPVSIRKHTGVARVRGALAIAALAIGLSAIAAVGVAAPASADAAPPPGAMPLEQVVARVEPSIVLLEITWSVLVYDTYNKIYLNHQKPIQFGANCTGFFVNPNGYIGSAGHCVAWADAQDFALEAAAENAKKEHYYKNDLTLEQIEKYGSQDYQFQHPRAVFQVYPAGRLAGFDNVHPLTARLVAFKSFDAGDVALLKVAATHTPALLLARDEDVQVGERAVSIGYPADVTDVTDPSLEPSFKDGTISSKRSRNDQPVYEISAAVGHGQSGGPTVNESGAVLGINSFGSGTGDTAFNFIREAATLQQTLNANGVRNETDAVERDYLAGLDAYYAGKRSEALKHFDSVLAVQPSHAFATHYRTLAANLPKPKGSGATRTILLIVGAIAAFGLALGLGGKLLDVRRRRASQTPGGLSTPGPVAASVATPRTASPAPAEPFSPRGSSASSAVSPGLQETIVGGSRPVTRGSATAAPRLVLVSQMTDEQHVVTRKLVIGRGSEDISVDGPETSRRHASVAPVAGSGIEIADLGSANGTFVNGQRIGARPIRLRAGDVVMVGETSLRVDERPAPTDPKQTPTFRQRP